MECNLYRLAEVLPRIAANCGVKNIPIYDCEVYSWPQTWSDTSCGFGGWAGQASTGALTVVLWDQGTGKYHVFHAGQFAYTVERPTDKFKDDFAGRNLLGVRSGWRGKYVHPDDGNTSASPPGTGV